jgi:hypothetical protein
MRRIVPWIVGVIVLSVALGALYLVAQQIERQGANDSPQRLATQIASDLNSADLPKARVDLASSLAGFYVVYDKDGKPEYGNGYLHGALASPPIGAIETAATEGTNSVSWEPEANLRFATVELRAGNHVVLAGQSLAPSETRTDRLGRLVALAWLAGMVALVAGAALDRWFFSRRPERA